MLIVLLVLLILLAAFFSASETGMMAVNRYRLRHLSKKSHRAVRSLKLLERPDRVLGLTLLGNTFSEIMASAIATILSVRFLGDTGALIVSVLLTLIILIFGEVAPKTWAALHSQRIALWVSAPLAILLKLFYPIIWIVNVCANGILFLFGVRVKKVEHELLSTDELRSIVHETAGKTPLHYQAMLLRVLDLQQLTVSEVMVPKNDIYGIDLTDEWPIIVERLVNSAHSYVPLFQGDIDKPQGMLRVRDALLQLRGDALNKTMLIQLAQELFFIPENALLHQQLRSFQREKKQIGLVVDEYGDIQGILTLHDVIEEIVGDLVTDETVEKQLIQMQDDDSVLVDGSVSVREMNRMMNWHLPASEARTLSGLITDYLEHIPKGAVCVRIKGYPMEIVSVSDNTIQQVRVLPHLFRA